MENTTSNLWYFILIHKWKPSQKSAKRIKSVKMLLEKFDVFINLLQKPLESSSNEKKNSLVDVKIRTATNSTTQISMR